MKKKATVPGNRRSQGDSRSNQEGKRVTLADVGRHCGYHGTTVGLALRNHPGIPEETRLKIQAAAETLGYSPDPALRALVVHRHGLAKGKGYSTIAVISDHPEADGWWRASDTGREYFEGMCRRAEELGYKLEEYSIASDHGLQHRVGLRAQFIGRACGGASGPKATLVDAALPRFQNKFIGHDTARLKALQLS